MPEDVAPPLTIYVARFEFENINLEHLERRRVSVIDMDMDYQAAEQLMKFLEKRFQKKTPGGIRVRIYGNLVIS